MSKNQGKKMIAVFGEDPVRRAWSETEEKWYFSVVDAVKILAQNPRPRKYWADLKRKLKQEGSQLSDKIGQLRMLAEDGKMRLTDVADVETLFRLIQSIPSPKAEPFKLWLAKVGYERMQETVDPELSIARGRKNWKTMGRSKKWVEQRMLGVETRHKLTDYWADHGVTQPKEYAILTNIIHEEWSGLSIKTHKQKKGLQQHNLRDHMNEAELLFTALAELSTRQIAEAEKAEGYRENEKTARQGGRVSKKARQDLEKQTGKKIVSGENYLPPSRNVKELKDKD